MNLKHLFIASVAVAALAACGTEDKDVEHNWTASFSDFNSEGYWNGCYNEDANYVDIDGFRFTHHAESYEWEGVTYGSWYGFCPSRSTDNADYSNGDWLAHQWSAITGGGVAGSGTPYVVGFWKTDGGETSCIMTRADGAVFYPDDLYVTNTSYGYYAMKNGTAFNHAFTEADECILHVAGYLGDVRKNSTVDIYLAKGTDILDEWKKAELSKLGNVDRLVFTISSSDTGQWGINNPTYFCIGAMEYNLPETYND